MPEITLSQINPGRGCGGQQVQAAFAEWKLYCVYRKLRKFFLSFFATGRGKTCCTTFSFLFVAFEGRAIAPKIPNGHLNSCCCCIFRKCIYNEHTQRQRSAVRRKNTVKKNLISIYFALVLSLSHSLTCVSHISQGCGMWNGNESVQF